MSIESTVKSITTATNENEQSLSQNMVLQHIAAASFGAIILFAVGFMPMVEAHNAAHDTRHSFAFPCH
ncbi:MAG: CbtB-domain containing protein [Psychrosphaera sp.]|nr:CbtB-domain containing protein [Psychrosphaera sp.]